jgi:hypothetical protein
MDRNRREILVVKNDCSGLHIVFVSSIALSEEWHPAVTAKLPYCMLNGYFDSAGNLRRRLDI